MDPQNSDGIILAESIQGDYKLSMWIPSDLAGRVVGKKGVVITNLQRETRVKQMSALSSVGDSLWIAVVMIGDWKAIAAAYRAVSDIVAGEVDDVVLEFTINYRKPCFLYRKGKLQVLKEISAQTNVRIFLPENAKETGFAHVEPMTLEGSFENVHRAVTLLEREATAAKELDKSDHLSKARDEESSDFQKNKVQKDFQKGKEENIERVESSAKVEEKIQTIDTELKSMEIDSSQSKTKVDRKTMEKHIDVPLNLVGLLLSRKPQLKISILNQIQGMTYTIISKIFPSKPEDALKKNDAEPNGEITPTPEEGEFVPFKIVGYDEENIDMAFEHLQKIINGERIKDVIEMLKVSTRSLPKPPNFKDSKGSKPAQKPVRKQNESNFSKSREPDADLE